MLNKIRNLFAKKDKRRIPLTHVHTFKTGEKLYTYSKEYYGFFVKQKTSDEIMDASTIGLNTSKLVLGKHSGKHALARKLESMGYHVSPEDLKDIFNRFKDLADKKKSVTEVDLEALVGDELYQPVEAWELVEVQVHSGTALTPTAVVKLKESATGEIKLGAAIGTGPVDAVYRAINEVVQVPNNLVEFLVQAITEGMDANGDVTIRIEVPDSRGYTQTAQGRQRRRLFSGRGLETDIIVASAKAYMQALNKLIDALKNEGDAPTGQVNDELVIEAGA